MGILEDYVLFVYLFIYLCICKYCQFKFTAALCDGVSTPRLINT
jgi:hypothetical protein